MKVRLALLVTLALSSITAELSALYLRPYAGQLQSSVDFLNNPRTIAGGGFEVSGVVHINGTNGFLFVDDDNTKHVLWLELASDGTQKGKAARIPLGAEIVDPEGMTTDGKYIYIVGSQSKRQSSSGVGLMRFVFDSQRRMIHSVESIRELKSFLAKALVELRNTDINIEGLAWDPMQNRLLLGLREPLDNGRALLVPLTLRQPGGPLSNDNINVGPPIPLHLDGEGIRSIEYDPSRKAFLVITGASQNKEDREFRLLLWSGTASVDSPPILRRFPSKLKPEGVTMATLDGSETHMLVFDVGRYSIGPLQSD